MRDEAAGGQVVEDRNREENLHSKLSCTLSHRLGSWDIDFMALSLPLFPPPPLCIMYAWVFMCVHGFIRPWKTCGGQTSVSGVILNHSSPYFLRQGLSLDLELSDWLG